MIFLLFFAFIAGIVTVLSPCILPVLPIILSSSDSSGKQRPVGVVSGFIVSFTFFTLFLSSIVRLSGIPADSLRFLSILILAFFGASLLLPKLQIKLEILFSRLSSLVPNVEKRPGFVGGFVIGLSLGLLWTPCVGPILASVISLAITGSVSGSSFLITLFYSLGTAIPMFIVMVVGSTALQKVPWLVENTNRIQKIFGVFMIMTAISIALNFDRRFQTFILQTFPGYGVGLTKFEDNQKVKDELLKINSKTSVSAIAPELTLGSQWFNSDPLTLQGLRGKVILVDFWTYTCINCQRTFPYLKNWWQKYEDNGLVIIGVHAPEFEFEKDPKNLEKAIKDFGLTYPIMQDNNFATWKSFNNRYWPAKYLIDKEGRIVYSHFGEGDYDITELKIQELLREAGAKVQDPIDKLVDVKVNRQISPESYLGYSRAEHFYPSLRLKKGFNRYTVAENIPLHRFSLGGEWTVNSEQSIARKNAILSYHFLASKVFLVMRPGEQSESLVNVYIDNKLIKQITVDSDKLYTIYDSGTGPEDHVLKIEFLTPGTEVFAFTFG